MSKGVLDSFQLVKLIGDSSKDNGQFVNESKLVRLSNLGNSEIKRYVNNLHQLGLININYEDESDGTVCLTEYGRKTYHSLDN